MNWNHIIHHWSGSVRFVLLIRMNIGRFKRQMTQVNIAQLIFIGELLLISPINCVPAFNHSLCTVKYPRSADYCRFKCWPRWICIWIALFSKTERNVILKINLFFVVFITLRWLKIWIVTKRSTKCTKIEWCSFEMSHQIWYHHWQATTAHNRRRRRN